MAENVLFGDGNQRIRAWDAIEALSNEAHRNAEDHGFYDAHKKVMELLHDHAFEAEEAERNFVLAQIAKIMSEGGEAVQEVRQGDERKVLIELADICIRVYDLASYLATGTIFAHALITKMEKNVGRPHLHGRLC